MTSKLALALGMMLLATGTGCQSTLSYHPTNPAKTSIRPEPPALDSLVESEETNQSRKPSRPKISTPKLEKTTAAHQQLQDREPAKPDLSIPEPTEPLPPPRRRISVPEKLSETPPAERLQQLVDDLDPGKADQNIKPLELEHVVESVVQSFPLIQAAMREAQVAAGKQLSAKGAFDLKIQAQTMNMPQGFYQNYRQLAMAEQPVWMGGSLYGQYRIGDGFFQPWYGERETNEGGEFKIGAKAPLLQNRAIDERRAEIAKANLLQAAVEPGVQLEIIDSVQFASNVYWSWVAAGQAYMVTRELLEIAQERNKAISRQVELGNLAVTELQQNERLIASREAKLIEAQRKLQSSAIKLSLFWRDESGQPVVPSPALLPNHFPDPVEPQIENIGNDVEAAFAQRPELKELAIWRQSVRVDLSQGQNEQLPKLDALVEASKDVGEPSSSKGDKTPYEFEAGFLFDVPLQRSKARGKVQSAQGKLTQISIKQRFTEDKITTEVQDAVSALKAAYERVERNKRSVTLARKLVNAEYRNFELGNSDVLRIAIQEAAELDAQILEIDALMDYFQAAASYRAALGDPVSGRAIR